MVISSAVDPLLALFKFKTISGPLAVELVAALLAAVPVGDPVLELAAAPLAELRFTIISGPALLDAWAAVPPQLVTC